MALPVAGVILLALSLLSGCSQETSEPEAPQVEQAATPSASLDPTIGEQIYQQVCEACHAVGVMDAPKFGNADDWRELIEEGYGVLVYESIKGEGNMPPRGGNPALTDMEVAHAVAYLANAAGADFVPPASEEALQTMLHAAKEIVEHEHDE